MPGRMEFKFHFSEPQTREAFRSRQDSPMRILVMGDFSGRGNRGVEDPSDLMARPTVAVDVDNFDEVLFGFAPCLHLPIGEPAGASIAIEFKQLDDLHPDQLYQKLHVFQALRETRQRLLDPATFAQTASELRHEAWRRSGSAEDAAAAEGEGTWEEDEASTFERLLGRSQVCSPEARALAPAPRIDTQLIIEDSVAPYIVPETDPYQTQYVASVDTAISDQMRRLLHHPAFQGLESAWRGVQWVVTNLELGERLQLHLLDVAKGELMADIQATQGNLETSGLYRLLVEQAIGTLGGQPWSVLVGHYTFGMGADDMALLPALGAIASQAGAPFLAAADPNMLGCRSLVEAPDPKDWQHEDTEAEQRWHALRNSSGASWIGLALPRVLLRLPYGQQTEPVEHFELEELLPPRNHEDYLWGNPALACALLIGRSLLERGWAMEPGNHQDLADLPAHIYKEDGESKLQACAEVYLHERAAEAMLSRGIMPLVSYCNRNAVHLSRFQSIAEPAKPLSGPWR